MYISGEEGWIYQNRVDAPTWAARLPTETLEGNIVDIREVAIRCSVGHGEFEARQYTLVSA